MNNTPEKPLLREVLNEIGIKKLAEKITVHHSSFQKEKFITEASKDFKDKSLTQRNNQICEALEIYLPQNYEEAITILLQILGPPLNEGETDWESFILMPQTLFVSKKGLSHMDLSLNALYEMTQRFTAEWAIRSFIEDNPKKVLETLHEWATDKSHHVRRLVSEGTRPRLPWGKRLKRFQENPEETIELLEKLKDDQSLYVRRSVANHINDITKDNPKIAKELLKRWQKNISKERAWIIKHAARSLIKKGDTEVLELFGYQPPKNLIINMSLEKDNIQVGETLAFTVEIESPIEQELLIEYIIIFQKIKGHRKKVFKWTKRTLKANQKEILKKTQKMSPLSTRKIYPGEHGLEIQINGHRVIRKSFNVYKNER